jgi:hypothetical protein
MCAGEGGKGGHQADILSRLDPAPLNHILQRYEEYLRNAATRVAADQGLLNRNGDGDFFLDTSTLEARDNNVVKRNTCCIRIKQTGFFYISRIRIFNLEFRIRFRIRILTILSETQRKQYTYVLISNLKAAVRYL